MGRSFQSMVDQIQNIFLPEILCLTAQIPLVIYSIRNVWAKYDRFPIKQLSPICTIILILCFPLANITNIIGRIIQSTNNYYDNHLLIPQCRTYNHPQMIVLACIYNFLRELPVIIFILRTMRVSICYIRKFYLSSKPSNILMCIFRSELNLILTCIVHTLIILQLNVSKANLLFQYFCPKQGSIFEYIIDLWRYSLLYIVYIMSIHTYSKLDFKKFLLLFFLASTSELLLRGVLVFTELNNTTYHQIYYHSILNNMFASMIMTYFSNSYDKVNQPPPASIFQTWKAFYNDELSIYVLSQYALHLDQHSQNKQNALILGLFRELDAYQKLVLLRKQYDIIIDIPHFQEILQIKCLKIPQKNISSLQLKYQRNQLQLGDLRLVIRYLNDYCKSNLYQIWKKTYSFYHLRQEFQNNSHINQKFQEFKITIQ